MSNVEKALQQLERLPKEDQLAAIALLEQKRRTNHYAKYWSSEAKGPEFDKFFDKIEENFSKFTQDIKIFGILGGNRASKSSYSTFIAAAWLLGKEYFRDEPAWRFVQHLPIPDHGVNIWVVGLSYEVVSKILWDEKLRKGLRHPGLIPNDPEIIERIVDSEGRQEVTVNVNGRRSTLTVKSAEAGAAKFQSASVDLVIIDEEPTKAVYDECYQRTVDCRGKIVISLTPLNDIACAEPWVWELHQLFQAGQKDICFVSLSVLDNPFIPADEKEKLKIKWAGHAEEGARLYGHFISRSGLVHAAFKQATHLIPRFRVERDWYRVNVIDPAPTGPTGCASIVFNPNGDAFLDKSYKQAGLIVSDHAKNILAVFGGTPVDVWLIDPRGGNQKNAETHRTCADLYRMNGIPVRFPQFDEEYGRDVFNEYLTASLENNPRHPKFFAFNDNPDFVDEICKYVWDRYAKGSQKGLAKDKPVKGNDDVLQCIHYALGFMNGRKPPRQRNFTVTPADRIKLVRNSSYT
jgi:phage terminase large subunit-like protein